MHGWPTRLHGIRGSTTGAGDPARVGGGPIPHAAHPGVDHRAQRAPVDDAEAPSYFILVVASGASFRPDGAYSLRTPVRPLLLLLLLMNPSQAADAPVGSWVAGPRYAAMKAEVRADVELAISSLGLVKRQVVRWVLIGATGPCAGVQITRAGSDLAITCGSFAPAVAPADGTEVAFTGDDGRTMRLSHRVEDSGALVQTFTNKHGSRQNRYTLLPEAGLHVEVTIQSPSLEHPLVYALNYR